MQVNPTGCMVKLVLLSTHGDTFYVGLNGLAIYDSNGDKIDINPEQLQGTPSRWSKILCAVSGDALTLRE
jgi:hypothetical protein